MKALRVVFIMLSHQQKLPILVFQICRILGCY